MGRGKSKIRARQTAIRQAYREEAAFNSKVGKISTRRAQEWFSESSENLKKMAKELSKPEYNKTTKYRLASSC